MRIATLALRLIVTLPFVILLFLPMLVLEYRWDWRACLADAWYTLTEEW